jgi:YfiH family protein
MIRPPGRPGAAYSLAEDGDQRRDEAARATLSAGLGISSDWATVSQVHGALVVEVDRPGEAGEADALFTTRPGLPLAVFTADCLGVVIHGEGAVGVAHGGWRGLVAGVVRELRGAMEVAGHRPSLATFGPSIGPCCFEVGDEVAEVFAAHTAETTWGAVSVDLWRAAASDLVGLEVWQAEMCTFHVPGSFSARMHRTEARMAAIGWLP